MRDLVASFAAALEAEIALIEKEGRDQRFELLSGRRDEQASSRLYVFLLADPLRVPEDAAGVLQTEGKEYAAMVASQEGNRIWILIDSVEELPPIMSSARLVLNQTELLRRLKERMDELGASGEFGLGAEVFGRKPITSRDGEISPHIAEDKRVAGTAAGTALAKATGSDVTFIWGPPGTGKTFTIAALVASLVEQGETILVTSHTHAAVDQALLSVVREGSSSEQAGFLYGNQLLDDGKILKVGVLRNERLKHVHLDGFLERKNKECEEDKAALQAELARISNELSPLEQQMRLWSSYNEARSEYQTAFQQMETTGAAYQDTAQGVEVSAARLRDAEAAIHSAKSSFPLGRSGRVRRAVASRGLAEAALVNARAVLAKAHAAALKARSKAEELYEVAVKAQNSIAGLMDPALLEAELSQIALRRREIQQEIEVLGQAAEEDAKALVRDAAAVFATLTKLYVDRIYLPDLTWDTVVIDEASMAMPPLVAYAASRAKKRVVVVGDMFQLPPVVQSKPNSPGEILTKSVFDFGTAEEIEANREPASVAKLTVQRRMHPQIAAVARHLIRQYADLKDEYSPSGLTMTGLPDAPLITVDIASLRSWSGRMPGSLSRFNLLSAQVADELAALCSRGLQ